jgi:hypothetical protein
MVSNGIALVGKAHRSDQRIDDGDWWLVELPEHGEDSTGALPEMMRNGRLADMLAPQQDGDELDIPEGQDETSNEVTPFGHLVCAFVFRQWHRWQRHRR